LIAACEQGVTPETPIVDQPIVGEWPSNGPVGYAGRTSLKEAFAVSRNAAAVRLTRQLGVGKVVEATRRIGIDPGSPSDPGFVLGSFSTNVMAMTGAYATVANGGYRVSPSGVLAVVDGRGQVRAHSTEAARVRAIPEKCIEPARTILGEVVRNGTGRGAALKRWQAFGKTGTTTGNADAWFIGWSEGRILGTWMGRKRGQDTGMLLAGAGAPADYFRRVMNTTNEWSERRRQVRQPPVATSRNPDPKSGTNASRAGRPSSTQAGKVPPNSGSIVLRTPLPPQRPRGKAIAVPGVGRPFL
jgi:penicillin-binding protein 1A